MQKKKRMAQRNFKDSWLLPCSLRSHRTANPTPKNGLRHFSALPAHHPNTKEEEKILQFKETIQNKVVILSLVIYFVEYG